MSYVWVCLNNKSAKMWGYTSFKNDDDSWDVIYFYGPVGRDMDFLSSTKKHYLTTGDANLAVGKLVDDKERKGYQSMTNMQYFDLTRDYLIALQDILDPPEEENIPLMMENALQEALNG